MELGKLNQFFIHKKLLIKFSAESFEDILGLNLFAIYALNSFIQIIKKFLRSQHYEHKKRFLIGVCDARLTRFAYKWFDLRRYFFYFCPWPVARQQIFNIFYSNLMISFENVLKMTS